jgi:NDP-sugar pyrophosphorylase family protein
MGRPSSSGTEVAAPDFQLVILAGGLGTRTGAMASGGPKALLPVAGKPFAEHQLSLLAARGARRVLYSIGYGGGQLRSFVDDGSRWGLEVSYVDEGEDLRGTAGALRFALDDGALDERFAVLYGDSYLPIDLVPFWTAFERTEAPALMTVLRNEDRWDRSNVVYRDGRVTRYDKGAQDYPNVVWIDYGLSALERHVVEERVPSGERADLAELFAELARERLLAGLEVEGRFYEVGSPSGIADLERFLQGTACPDHVSRRP